MGKPTISMAMFNSFLYVYQSVNEPCSTPKEPITRRRWLSSRLSGLSGLPCLASPGLGVENDRSGEWVFNGIEMEQITISGI